jgi:hypothetical protein
MLTRKQQWRRTRERIPKPLTTPKTDSFDDLQPIPTKGTGVDQLHSTATHAPAPKRLKSALSSSNLLGLVERRHRDQRLLRFSSTVHVLLIPSRVELMPSFENIYWLHEDYAYFKREAVKEIREAARVYGIPAKAAMTLLYQPVPEPVPEEGSEDEATAGMVYEEEPQPYDYYVSDYASNYEYSNQNVSIDYQYHCNNHPAALARKDSNFLLDHQASPHSVTMSSPKTSRDLAFITNVKTDVELNASTSSDLFSDRRRTTQPRRTTTSAPQKQHAWAVQWKKQPAA